MFDRPLRHPPIWQRLLLGLGLSLLLALIGVLIISVLYPGGPVSLTERGEAALREGRPLDAVGFLDEAERNLPAPRDPELLERIYRARSRAHLLVGNLGFAERDLLAALDLPLPEESLNPLKIALARSVHMQRAGQFRAQGEHARAETELNLALKLVRHLARSGRGTLLLQACEAAGEACQRHYQLLIARIQDQLRIPLSSQLLLEANKILLDLVFLPEQSPKSQALRRQLEQIFIAGDLAPSRRAWVDERIQDARGWVVEAFDFYGQVLGPPEAFAALQGISGLLSQTGRTDEATMICRIALDTWESPFLGRAAERLAEIQRQAGRPQNARRILEEWSSAWPPSELIRRFGSFPSQAQDAWILAMDLSIADQDGPALEKAVGEMWKQRPHWAADMARLMPYFGGMLRALMGWEPDLMETMLAEFAKTTAARPAGWVDRYRIVQEARVEKALLDNRVEQALAILTQWIEQRPWETAARLRRAEVLMGQRKEDEALVDLQKAYSIEPTDAILERIWEARSGLLARQGHSGSRLAKSLLERGALFSQNLPHRHLHLELARHLLTDASRFPEAAPMIAEGALFQARLATQVYPGSPSVQMLLDEARLASGRPEEARAALSSLETLRSRLPEHPEVLRLLWLAGRALGRADPGLERDLVRHGDSPEAARLLARGLLGLTGATHWEQALNVASRALARFGASDPDLNLLAGEASRRLRRPLAALRFLEAIEPSSSLFWEARKRRIEILLSTFPGPLSEAAVEEYLTPSVPADEALEVAELLLANGRPAQALRILRALASTENPSGSARSGRLFLVLARALHATGQRREALIEAEKALGFPDGQEATRFLALAFLCKGRVQDASEILALSDKPELVPPLERATLFALTGQPVEEQWVTRNLEVREGFWDQARRLALHALLGQELFKASDPASLEALITAHPPGVALVLLLLDVPGFGRDAFEVARKHFRPDMDNPFGRLLHARARIASGEVERGLAELVRLVSRHPGLPEAWELLYRDMTRITEQQNLLFRTHIFFQILLPTWQARMGASGEEPIPADLEFPADLTALMADWGRFLGQGAAEQDLENLARHWSRVATHFTGLSLDLRTRVHPRGVQDRALTALFLSSDTRQTWRTMAKALEQAEGERLARLADAFFRVSSALPDLHARSREIAESLAERSQGPCGPALHFLLATDAIPAAEAARARLEQLRRHLEHARGLPIASIDFLFAGSTARLMAPSAPQEAREAALELLERCPAHWGAWEALALAEEALGHVDAARRIFDFPHRFLDPSPMLAMETALTARLDLPGLPPEQALSGLDPTRSPLADMALGLWNLRMGRTREALTVFGKWPWNPTPEVLFYRAAALISSRPPNHDDARRDLETLSERHPSHPLARHAHLVLKMLAPPPD